MGEREHHCRSWLGAILLVVSFLLLTLEPMNTISEVNNPNPDISKVPPPQVNERHEKDNNTLSESWGVDINHGNLSLSYTARNLTQNDPPQVDYQYSIGYHVNGSRLYLAQFSIFGNATAFKIGGRKYMADMSSCSGFEVTKSPVTYNGSVPELFGNVTYKKIRVLSGGSKSSTFDLTIFHHFRMDWNVSDTKIAFQFDLTGTKLYDENGTEYPAGTPFEMEIMYDMSLWYTPDPVHQNPLMPVGFKNETMQYNIIDGTGKLITLSKLKVLNNFTVSGSSGTRSITGYSSINYGWRSEVRQGYPNLTYGNTQKIESDPMITSYHDRVQNFSGGGNGGRTGPNRALVAAVWIPIIVIIAAGVLLFRNHRNKKRSKKGKRIHKVDKNEQLDEKDKEIQRLKSELAELKKK